MKEFRFPCRLLGVVHGPGAGQVARLCSNYKVIASVRIKCVAPGYPVHRGDHTYYATGTFETTLAGPELLRALRCNEVVSVRSLASYEADDLFSEWVDYCYHQREHYKNAGNTAFAWMIKLLMNSLFGKFGQWRGRWESVDDVFAKTPLGYFTETDDGNEMGEVYRSLGWFVQKLVERTEHPDSFPAIAAFVTAHARERIQMWRWCAGERNCYYSDTDSLHVNDAGLAALSAAGHVGTGELGKLRLVSSHQKAEYLGLKHYWLDERPTIAGIKASAIQSPGGTWVQEEFSRLPHLMAHPDKPYVVSKVVTIDRSQLDLPGTVGDGGWIVPPCLTE